MESMITLCRRLLASRNILCCTVCKNSFALKSTYPFILNKIKFTNVPVFNVYFLTSLAPQLDTHRGVSLLSNRSLYAASVPRSKKET